MKYGQNRREESTAYSRTASVSLEPLVGDGMQRGSKHQHAAPASESPVDAEDSLAGAVC